MAFLAVGDLKEGMILAEDVVIFGNKLLLPKGTELTDYLINKLGFYSVQRVKIKESSSEDNDESEDSSVNSYSKRLKRSSEYKAFKEEFFKSIYKFKTDFLEIANNDEKIDSNELVGRVYSVIESSSGINVFDMLHCMREYDDSTYVHALNTSLICNVFGKWLGMNKKDLDALTLAGLLHDIGKIRVSDSITRKTEELTPSERNLMQAHTIYGYEILKNQDIDERVKAVALMHHERCDGTGYPKAYKSSQINDFAKIVGIASEYDSLTSARAYRDPICPFDVIKQFELEGFQKYDARYILTFLEHISNAFINNTVLLSDGQTAEIVMINKQFLSRPVVKAGNTFIDLSKDTELYIKALV